jgi:long-subunit fatty acid transport protein
MAAAAVMALVLSPGLVMASGFRLAEQNGSGLGNVYSGQTAGGLEWTINEKNRIDLGYASLFIDDATSNLVANPQDPDFVEQFLGGNLVGTYTSNVNVFSFQHTLAFQSQDRSLTCRRAPVHFREGGWSDRRNRASSRPTTRNEAPGPAEPRPE